jgi:hypothetical protein
MVLEMANFSKLAGRYFQHGFLIHSFKSSTVLLYYCPSYSLTIYYYPPTEKACFHVPHCLFHNPTFNTCLALSFDLPSLPRPNALLQDLLPTTKTRPIPIANATPLSNTQIQNRSFRTRPAHRHTRYLGHQDITVEVSFGLCMTSDPTTPADQEATLSRMRLTLLQFTPMTPHPCKQFLATRHSRIPCC